MSGAELVPPLLVLQTVALVADDRGGVFRREWPEEWPVNPWSVAPGGSGVVQLMRSEAMRPIVGDGDGMLAGEIIEGEMSDGDRKIWVLSDPDVLSNHGLLKGDNAAFMVTLLDSLRMWNNDDPGAPIVFDEALHGFQVTRDSPFKALFRLPFGIVTFLAFCAAALLALTGSQRFGAPRRASGPGASLDFGRANLIDNSARLLDYAGHHAVVLRRYVRMTIHFAADRLHAPGGLSEPALTAWLDRIGNARGARRSCTAILASVTGPDADRRLRDENLSRLFESAGEIHRWKREILGDSE
jgi:hypothetical protein